MDIFMDRSNLPSADPSTVWLADLIEATEAVAASTEPCDPAIVEAFSRPTATGGQLILSPNQWRWAVDVPCRAIVRAADLPPDLLLS